MMRSEFISYDGIVEQASVQRIPMTLDDFPLLSHFLLNVVECHVN